MLFSQRERSWKNSFLAKVCLFKAISEERSKILNNKCVSDFSCLNQVKPREWCLCADN